MKPERSVIAERQTVETEPRKAPSLRDQVAVLRRQARCFLCHAAFTDGLHFDHSIPLALGGPNDSANLQALCVKCHGAKTKADVKFIAKANRLAKTERGERSRKRRGPAMTSANTLSGDKYRRRKEWARRARGETE